MAHLAPRSNVVRWITVIGLAISGCCTVYSVRVFPRMLAQEASASELARFEQYLNVLRQRVRIPGLSGAIVHHQRIIWEQGFGFQDVDMRIAARPDTPYRIASLTKTFTSILLMGYSSVIARVAKPYSVDARQRTITADYPPRVINASVGIISTVRDLANYDAAIDRHVLVSAETQALAWTPFRTSTGVEQPHALGWFVQRYRGTRLVWHYGYWPQFSALCLKVPERELTLILLANSGELSSPFPLGAGDVTRSAFAHAFLRMFVD
jgi:CubicO group peptidase (beta-lactamase class C family)